MKRSSGEYDECCCEANKPGSNPGDDVCYCRERIWFPKGAKMPDFPICSSCAGGKHMFM